MNQDKYDECNRKPSERERNVCYTKKVNFCPWVFVFLFAILKISLMLTDIQLCLKLTKFQGN